MQWENSAKILITHNCLIIGLLEKYSIIKVNKNEPDSNKCITFTQKEKEPPKQLQTLYKRCVL